MLRRVSREEHTGYYVHLVARLTGWTLSEEEAKLVWIQVLEHWQRLREQGPDVSVERATVDYFKRLRLAGLDRTTLWEVGQAFTPSSVRESASTARPPSVSENSRGELRR